MNFRIRDFGVSVPFSGTSSVMDAAMERLRKARDECLDHQTLWTWHCAAHSAAEREPWCWFCSWAFKFSRFWHEVEWWASTCTGCGKVMYACNYSCDLWEDY